MFMNRESAAEWFTKAAVQGDPDSQCSLGVYQQFGVVGSRDERKAAIWFAKAARQGHTPAKSLLSELINTSRKQQRGKGMLGFESGLDTLSKQHLQKCIQQAELRNKIFKVAAPAAARCRAEFTRAAAVNPELARAAAPIQAGQQQHHLLSNSTNAIWLEKPANERQRVRERAENQRRTSSTTAMQAARPMQQEARSLPSSGVITSLSEAIPALKAAIMQPPAPMPLKPIIPALKPPSTAPTTLAGDFMNRLTGLLNKQAAALADHDYSKTFEAQAGLTFS